MKLRTIFAATLVATGALTLTQTTQAPRQPVAGADGVDGGLVPATVVAVTVNV